MWLLAEEVVKNLFVSSLFYTKAGEIGFTRGRLTSGLLQCSALGTVLFSMYINGLSAVIKYRSIIFDDDGMFPGRPD